MNPRPNNLSSSAGVSRSLTKPIPVLFENDHVIVFDKPAGVLVIPAPNDDKPSLTEIVNYQYRDQLPKCKLHPCHRIDRDTSGLVMYAKGKQQQKRMMELFRTRDIDKVYLAIVQGKLKRKTGKIEGFISQPNQIKYSKSSPEKMAISFYRVVRESRQTSLVEVRPVTGRTNQIRIQFSQFGHPLLGDRKYSIAKNYAVKFRRPALHAQSLSWIDPETKKQIKVQSTLPNDMEAFCARNGT